LAAEGADDIDGDHAFVSICEREFRCRDACILKQDVDAWEFGGSVSEGFDGLIREQVKGPDFEDIGGTVGARCDAALCFFACVGVADSEDDSGCAETGEVACCFTAQADVGAGDDDGLTNTCYRWIGRRGEELRVKKSRDRHSGMCGSDGKMKLRSVGEYTSFGVLNSDKRVPVYLSGHEPR
jgi:hypothetical protein